MLHVSISADYITSARAIDLPYQGMTLQRRTYTFTFDRADWIDVRDWLHGEGIPYRIS